MTVQTVKLKLPEVVYERIQRAAAKARRPVNDVLVEAVVAATPPTETAPETMRSALAQMAYFNDAALWQAARATMTTEQRKRLQFLHDQQQRATLIPEERVEEQALLGLYRETLLVRAQAAALLQQRGYDISDPKQFEPLE